MSAKLRAFFIEYGLPWFFFRFAYVLKIKVLRVFPFAERVFEKQVDIKRVFDFQIDTESISSFLVELPDEKKQKIIVDADNVCKGKIRAFSSLTLDYGVPVNWHLNPLTGKTVDQKLKWFQIPDFDSERGDVKVIWEASRFSHFYTLSRAFLLTGKEKYYLAFSDQLTDWLKANPYSFGVNHKCGQEASLRLVNVLMAYSIFRSAGLITTEDEENVRELVRRCYKKVRSNFFYAYRCIRNNHTLSELCGMIIGAWCCEDKKTISKAYRLLERVIAEQFKPDGGYSQFSFNYQRLALHIMACVLRVSSLIGNSLSEDARQRVLNSALLMYKCQDKAGDVPNYGSNDGALIFPVTSCDYRDYRLAVNIVSVLLSGKRLFSQGLHDEELLWFAPDVSSKFEGLARVSTSFTEAGLYTLRNNESFVMLCLNRYTSRPAHMDQLHMDVWHNGINVLCDAGTYSYADPVGQRLALTEAHNIVKIPGREQMNRTGAFMVYGWSQPQMVQHQSDSFTGLMKSRNGYSHKRHVQLTTNGFIIEDEVRGDAEYCDYLFHTPCDVKLVEGFFVFFDQHAPVCRLFSVGEIEVMPCQRSLFYLQLETISLIRIRKSLVDGEDSNCVEFIYERKQK